MTHKPLLIESWLPIQAIGAESQRERGASSALPPLYFLHVWWARRPLTTSRAAILASVLPEWSADFPPALLDKFPNEETYKKWFTFLVGIRGDPVKGRKIVAWAKDKGIKLKFHPYGGAPRAFTVNPATADLETLGDLVEWTWGKRDINTLDPFAGGGSIPFEALRYGLTSYANDLNPVSAVILKATLDYPARFGPGFAEEIRKWGNEWAKRVKEKLDPYFPRKSDESIFAYIWARTIACPVTGKPIPLSPNWWLSAGDKPIAVQMIVEPHFDRPKFEIVTGAKATAGKPDEGTIARAVARSPWTGETVEGDYIKAEAQAGRMRQILYAIAIKKPGGLGFRVPSDSDLDAFQNAEKFLAEKLPNWQINNLIPTEIIPDGNKTSEPLRYGSKYWIDMFGPRQLLSIGIYLETLRELQTEISASNNLEMSNAILTYLAIVLDKTVIYNNRSSRFNPERGVRSNFDRHDFAFVWSHAEFDAANNLLTWGDSQIADAYEQITNLIFPSQLTLESKLSQKTSVGISNFSATSLYAISNESIYNITVDPPYYDNVQYSELADFFYVWLKRSVGHLYPEFFRDELTNKDDEAVANPARFASMGKKKKELAEQDYENKMTAAFREMYRVLKPEGSLTVMFTHKKVEAWDTLASALINAGFVIKASWPVHTESEHSIHQAKKNAAASTILLVCRKRDSLQSSGEATWWDDLAPRVREAARQKAEEFSAQGISGVDLYISTFGPALSIISEHWPVLTSEVDPKTAQPKTLRPETALDLAREEVVRLRKQGLLAGRDVRFDPVTDWYLMAWDAFHAEEFPYDEGRKLAIALGVDMDRLIMASKRLAIKKSSSVVLQVPAKRSKKDMVDPDLTTFEHWIDAAHTAMLIYEEDGAGACDVFLRKANLKTDSTFKALLQSMINAIPRARIKGRFARSEAETLEDIRLAFFPDLTVPVEEEHQLPVEKQIGMFEEVSGVDVDEETDEGEE
jgi:putative DNA methylase